MTGWPLNDGVRRTRQAGDDIDVRVADGAEADEVEACAYVGGARERAGDARPVPVGDEVGVDAVLGAGDVVLDCVVNGVFGGGRGADDQIVVVQVEAARPAHAQCVHDRRAAVAAIRSDHHRASIRRQRAGANLIYGQGAGAFLGEIHAAGAERSGDREVALGRRDRYDGVVGEREPRADRMAAGGDVDPCIAACGIEGQSVGAGDGVAGRGIIEVDRADGPRDVNGDGAVGVDDRTERRRVTDRRWGPRRRSNWSRATSCRYC